MNFFTTIIHTCFGFKSYAQLLDTPYRDTVKYLAKLVGLLSLVLVAVYLPAMLARLPEIGEFVDREFPRFTVQKGAVVLTPSDMAANANYSHRHIVLDLPEAKSAEPPSAETTMSEHPASPAPTEAEAQSPSPAATAAVAPARPAVIIKREEIIIQDDVANGFAEWLMYGRAFEWKKRDPLNVVAPTPITLPSQALPSGAVNGDYVQSYLWKAIPMAFVMMTLLAFAACLAQSHLFAGFSSMLEQHLPVRFTYWQLLNLATFAITPAAIIVTIYAALGLEGLPLPIIYLVAYGIFLIGSTNSCRPRKEEAAVDDSEMY